MTFDRLGVLVDVNIPFIFETISQFEDLDLYLSFAVMLEDLFVGLPLLVLERIEVLWIWLYFVADSEVRFVGLYVS